MEKESLVIEIKNHPSYLLDVHGTYEYLMGLDITKLQEIVAEQKQKAT